MNQSDSLLMMRQVARIEELGSQVNELTESNRQLREERNVLVTAHEGLEARITTLTTALAAAKEALEVAGAFTAYDSEAKDRYSFHRSLAYNKAIEALARIAECEKDPT